MEFRAEVTGLNELQRMLAQVPLEAPKIVKAATHKALKPMQQAMVASVGPAITPGHNNQSLKRAMGVRVNTRDNQITTAKVGVGVNQRRGDVEAEGTERKKRIVGPHAHLYYLGTTDRWTGQKRQSAGRDARGKRKFIKKLTGKPRIYRGRMDPSRYLRTPLSQVMSSTEPQVEQIFIEEVSKGVNKVLQ